jgi:hypothetical protein
MIRLKVAKNSRQQYEWVLAQIPSICRGVKDGIVSLVIEAHKRRVFRKKPFAFRRTKERMKKLSLSTTSRTRRRPTAA